MSARDFSRGRGPGAEPLDAPPPPPGGTFTLADLLAAILRHKFLVLTLALAGGLGGFLAAKQITPRYGASALLVSEAALAGISEGGSRDAAGMIDPSVTPTIVETIGSPVVLDRTLLALPPETYARLLADSGIGAEPEADAEAGPETDPAAAAALERQSLRQSLSDRLEVTNSGQSYVVYVTYVSEDAELAAEIANAVANAYLDYRSALRRDGYSMILRSLEGEIAKLKSELQAAERTAQTMREQVRLLAARGEALTGRQQAEAITESSHLYARQREAEREAEATAAVYERLLFTQREILSRIGTPELDVRLFAPAPVPLRPDGFNVKPVLLVLGLAGGFCLGASLALLRERWPGLGRRRKP